MRGTCKDQYKPTGPWSKESTQTDQGQGKPIGSTCSEPDTSNPEERDGGMGKEGVSSKRPMFLLSLRNKKIPPPQIFLPGRNMMQCCFDL